MHTKCILFLVLCCFIFKTSPAQTKHALIVAIGNYPNPDQNLWPVINSVNDVPLIKNALVNNQNFNENNIQVLTDAQATKKGIIDALDKLISGVNRGDIVEIHFSSHGEQLEDDNNDEIDGLDEVIVPYGAVYSQDETKLKELSKGYLRDDLFGEKITQLRNKLGKEGDVLVTLDACHSGSGTRGVETAKIRGGNLPMVSNKFNANNFSAVDTAGVFKETTATKLSADAATFVLISGAQAKEINSECRDDNDKPAGSLSYAFSKALSSIKGTITYQGLFAMIENIMHEKARNQRPVLEGDGINRELFGGKYQKQQSYFTINISQSKKGQIVINGGFIAGITTGSVINFYEPGTNSTAGKTPVGIGKVISAASYTATVQLDSPDDNLVKLNPWAFISELAYGTQKLKLLVKGDKGFVKMLEDSLKDFQLVEFNSNCDLYLDTAGSLKTWALKYPNSDAVFVQGLSFNRNQNIVYLKEALKQYDRFRYLKGLQFNDLDLSADVQLLFFDDKGSIDSNKLQSRTHLGHLELREGDKVYLQIINNGKKQFYINIVDIQPDGVINAVLPNKNAIDKNGNPNPIKLEDCLLKKEGTLNFSIGISKPYGEETFKVFLSSSPLDLEDILTSKNIVEAKNTRGILSGLEKLFVESNVNEAGTRGVIATKVNTNQNGTIFSYNFQIVPK